jgi:hypothetical protein
MALVAAPNPGRHSMLELLIGGYLVPVITALVTVAVGTAMPTVLNALYPPAPGHLVSAAPSGLTLVGVLIGTALVMVATSPYRRFQQVGGRHSR